MTAALVQLWAIIAKEFQQIQADKRMIGLLIIAPLVQVLVFSSAIDFDVDRVPAVVVDLDQSATSRTHIRRLLADGTLTAAAEVPSAELALDMLEDGDAAAAVIVPAGLERAVLRGEGATVQVLLDGTDPNRAGVASGAISRYFAEASRPALPPGAHRAGLRLQPRVYYNPTLVTSIYMIPGVIAMLLVVVTALITAMGLAREREMGTLEQVMVTPIPTSVLLLGKIIPYVLVGLFDVSLALAAGAWLFGLPIRGSLLLLALATLLYLLSTLAVGLLIATVSQTQQQAFLGGFLFMLPAILLSGNLTPVAAMPPWLQWFTYINPLRYYIAILRANLLKGAGFADVGEQLLALAVFGAVLLTIAIRRFRKRIA